VEREGEEEQVLRPAISTVALDRIESGDLMDKEYCVSEVRA